MLWWVTNGLAAAPRDRLHRGRLDLDEPPTRQHLAEGRDDLRPAEERLQALGVVGEVDVSLAGPLLDIGQAVPLLGGRQEALAEERQDLGEDRQLAGPGPAEAAVNADQVAQVQLRGESPAGVADLVLADHHLDRPGPVADLEERNLPLPSLQDDPTRDPDLGPDGSSPSLTSGRGIWRTSLMAW